MAISKSKVLENGAQGAYWKISTILLNRIDMHVHVNMGLFVDKNYSDVGKGLGYTKEFIFGVTKEEAAGDLAALAYSKIKESGDADIAGGEDV